MDATTCYVLLSAMMFLEYAIWGAWAPVLAARLLGPLKMTGKQTGWIYATLPIGAMISPWIAGPLADQSIDARWILVVSHAIGAVLLFLAIKQIRFSGLFGVMFVYGLFYGATIPLVNSVMFRHLKTAGVGEGAVFIWAPVAWALVGYALTGFRSMRKSEGDGSDCLVFAAVLSVAMAVVCAIQPETAPKATEGAMGQVLAMLKDVPFLVFILASLVIAGMMQFYFLGTAQLMQDRGLKSKFVPGAMAIAQAVQAAATWFLLMLFFGDKLGPKWTLVLGAGCWMTLFLIYVAVKIPAVLVIAQALHGLAYVFFIIAGQVYVKEVAGEAIASSAQAFIIFIQAGIGLFLGTQLAGWVMDRCSVEGKFQWSKVFAVPAGCVLAGIVALVLVFSDPPKAEGENKKGPDPKEKAPAAQKQNAPDPAESTWAPVSSSTLRHG
ncbi:MAG: MFS transporter [Pirellulales bacterium]|nr:MFS transporter [Pirellulales bacterium]